MRKAEENLNLSSPFGGQGAAIFPLSEGTFTIDKTKLFVPLNEGTENFYERAKGSLLVEVQPFLVVTSKDILLLDAGLGFTNSAGMLQIHENIRAAGYEAKDVTKVLLTHLHKDHAGGIGNPHPGNYQQPDVMNFPNATFYLQRRELDFAWQKGFPSFLPDEIEPLLHSPQVLFLHDDEGVIDEYIFYEVTGAHSPFHQVFWIKESSDIIFFGGDDAPQLQQMKIRYKTKYDYDPEKAMQLRHQWWEQGNKEGWRFLFYHDTAHPTFLGARD